MNFAKNVSSRVFYMDEGIIYEEGKPEQIFDNPQKQKTRAFIMRLKSFHYDIPIEGFDYVEYLNGIDNFCQKNTVERKKRNKINLLSEEMVMTLLRPLHTNMTVDVQFPENQETYKVIFNYEGKAYNPLDDKDADEMSLSIVQNSAQKIEYNYDNGNNCLTIDI
jgi:polar amino acid transport system ATP-binding protein